MPRTWAVLVSRPTCECCWGSQHWFSPLVSITMCKFKHIFLAQEEADKLGSGQGRPLEHDKEG